MIFHRRQKNKTHFPASSFNASVHYQSMQMRYAFQFIYTCEIWLLFLLSAFDMYIIWLCKDLCSSIPQSPRENIAHILRFEIARLSHIEWDKRKIIFKCQPPHPENYKSNHRLPNFFFFFNCPEVYNNLVWTEWVKVSSRIGK